MSGSLFGAPPWSTAHLPGSIMARLMQAETSITAAEAETTAQNTREGTGKADAGRNRLCCRFRSFDSGPDGSLMGAHGVTWVYIHVYMPVYIISMVFMCGPPALFSLDSGGGFSCGSLLRKKQLRIPKQSTTMGDIIGAMCVPFLSQVLSGLGLAIFNLCPAEPTYGLATN